MHKAFRFAISGSVAAVLLSLALLPESVWSAGPVVCVYRNALSVECLGCGMTRALAAATHGHWEAALGFNRGVVLALPLLLMAVVLPLAPNLLRRS
jgi:hypothetical protein